jgi:hypothetical protein
VLDPLSGALAAFAIAVYVILRGLSPIAETEPA